MAQEVILPKQGQSVETCLILSWKKKVGEQVREGEVLVEVETDKAAFEIPAPTSGTLLKILHQEGEDVPVLSALAVIGQAGEVVGETPAAPAAATPSAAVPAASRPTAGTAQAPAAAARPSARIPISPRARRLAERSGLNVAEAAAALSGRKGSGPGGRILEMDVRRFMESRPARPAGGAAMAASAAASAVSAAAGAAAGAAATGAGAAGPAPAGAAVRGAANYPGPVTEVAVKGVRKIIAERMLASLASTAQYTLHAYAEAEMLAAYRRRLKDSPEELGLRSITIGDLVSFAAARLLARHPEANALFLEGRVQQFQRVHLAFAVDTPRGLLVPVIRNADLMSLKQLSGEASRLRQACLEGRATPEELNGGTFTVTNLGALGIDHFTPVLNPPQVAILGVGGISFRPVQAQENAERCPVVFKRHIALSLTANHQVLDGAPAARFLAELCNSIGNIGLTLAG
jgi:pyruvate dehydrogenase E2 component (dihydrolipoamide acetyltransferase)